MKLATIPTAKQARLLCSVVPSASGPINPIEGAIHLALSIWIRENKDYASYYACRPKRDYLILDNSAHETSIGDSHQEMGPLINQIHPDEIALPDRLFFGDDTIERSREAATYYREHFPDVRLMGIPQGRTREEFHYCLQELLDLGIETVGLSKDYEVWHGGLVSLVDLIETESSWRYGEDSRNVDIHLLGWARGLYEPVHVEREFPGRVRSIDTAKAVVYAMSGISLPKITRTTQVKYPRRPQDYLHSSLSEEEASLSLKNISTLREAIGDSSISTYFNPTTQTIAGYGVFYSDL